MLLVLGATVWPTLYRYDKVSIGQNTLLIRMNRLTGSTEVFRGTRWVRGDSRPGKDPLPVDQVAKITGNAALGWSTFSGKIYNGSDWVLVELLVQVTARKKATPNATAGTVLWSRQFRIPDLYVPPLEVRSFSIDVTGAEEANDTEWSVVAAWGRR